MPAWSAAFDPAALPDVDPLPLPVPLTADWAWGAGTGAGVDVAVVDSGIEAGHPAVGVVQGAVAFRPDPDRPGEVLREDGPHDDLFGHGTACAGIVRALAPQCRLHSVRVLGERLSGKGAVFAAGLEWALDAGVHVVNLSLSTSRPDWYGRMHELADRAAFEGVMLVCALSNVPGPSFPSQFASVFSVAARPGDDPFRVDHNPRAPAEWGARGIDVEVAWTGGTTLVTTGNSFAAAHVSGLVARLLGTHPGLTPFEVKTVLRAVAGNARRADGATPAGRRGSRSG